MEIVKLTREMLGANSSREGCRSVSFSNKGIIVLSKSACDFLRVNPQNKNENAIDLFQGKTESNDFFISKGTTFRVRKNNQRGAVFNCSALAKLVRERTWNAHGHAVGEKEPKMIRLFICENSVEKDKKNVFALLRKK